MSWKLLVARGVVGIIFGIMAMAWPIKTAFALVLLWGFWALFDGLGNLVGAFSATGVGNKILFAVLGLVGIAAGVFAFTRPFTTAVALTWFLGIWLIARGIVDLMATLMMGKAAGPIVLGILSSLLSIVAGVIFAANPGRSAVALAFWLGFIALLWGIVFLVTGLMARKEIGKLDGATPAAA